MSLITINAGAEYKKDMVLTSPAPGGVTATESQAILWVGPLIEQNKFRLMVLNGIEKALNTLRDAPGRGNILSPGNFDVVDATFIVEANHLRNFTFTGNTTLPVPATNAILIAVGGLFGGNSGSSFTAAGKRAAELWLEQVGKKLAA